MKLRHLYTALIALLAAFVLYTAAGKNWLQTDLTALLPQEQQDVVLQAADKAGEAQLNSQVILLAGSDNAETAFQTASKIADLWKQSGVFSEVNSSITPDLVQVRSDMQHLGLAVLPSEQRRQLFENPKAYFQERAEAAVNPFAASPLSLEQDWLGFGRFVSDKANPQSRLQWNADNGMLFTENSGKTWVFLRGKLPEGGIADNGKLLPLMEKSRELAAADKTDILTAGGALFAAVAKTSAESESQMMSMAGLLLTFALLLWVFHSMRVFWLFLPLAAGLLTGLAAALMVFGEVHILTIVIGTSLLGMLVDFPLHWLAPSVFTPSDWRAEAEMKRVRPSFIISLSITVLGYALLWFTPLSVLRQTAVFSGFSLLGAFGATILWLPPLFKHYHGKHTSFAALTSSLFMLSGHLKNRLHKRGWWLLGGVLLLLGLWRSDWRDDIRQWVNMPSEMLAQVQQIGTLSGMDFSGQYLVVEAENEDALLNKNAAVSHTLQTLVEQGKLGGIQSIDQFIAPTAEQQKLQNRLRELAKLPETWQAMRDIGVPRKTMREALNQAADTPVLTLSDGMKPALAEAWRNLYLGEVAPKRYASVIRLNSMNDAAAVQQAVSPIQGVHWADKRAHLNQLFHHTRNQAAWLKIASYALALLALWKIFGLRQSLKILAVPLSAAVMTVAALGWAGIPVSLFAMFGLLLVSAIGADYAVYAQTAPHSAQARLGGMLLAALTTGISFILLAASSTPAVAAFGITVTLGVIFNICLAGLLLDKPHAV